MKKPIAEELITIGLPKEVLDKMGIKPKSKFYGKKTISQEYIFIVEED